MRTATPQPATSNARLPRLAAACAALAVLLLPMGCAMSAGVANSPAQAQQATTSTGVVRAQFFGMEVKNAAHQPAVAAGARRLADASVTWAALEPAAGAYSWSSLDAEVAAAEAAGAEITLTLGMTPAWASTAPQAPSAWGTGATVMPASLATWDAYVGAVAARYAGRIAHYEVWNNPADAANWSGQASLLGENMAELAAHAAAAVAAADASATVVAPALTPGALGDFLAAGGASSVGSLAVSLSPAGSAPEVVVAQLNAVRAALAPYPAAERLPLWNDQPAWTLPADGSAADPETQAAFAARALVLNASFGVGRLSWYAWDENGAGVLQLSDSNGSPTAAAAAYSTVQGWLAGAQVNGCSASPEGVWSCQLARGGAQQWILWSATGTVEASSLGMSTSTSLDGSIQAVAGEKLTLTGSPVLLQ